VRHLTPPACVGGSNIGSRSAGSLPSPREFADNASNGLAAVGGEESHAMRALRNSHGVLPTDAAPFAIRSERASDVVAREALLDAAHEPS